MYTTRMNAEGHLKKAENIYASIRILCKDDGDLNAPSIVELAYGCAIQYLTYGCQQKFDTHLNTHVGLPKLLSRKGAEQAADTFRELDTIRHGGWYGGKGNGATVKRAISCLEVIIQWST
ncbi:MAG: hypothetical protein WCG09_09370 [Halobacteriota archaeon]